MVQTCTLVDTVRKPRIAGMAVFDWVASLLGGWIVGSYIGIHGVTWIVWFLLWILFGVVVHLALGVNTMLGYYLGVNPKPTRSVCS